MYKHPTFEKKTLFFPYSFKSALFTELITLTFCTSSGKPKTLEEIHLFLARHFPLEREKELAQVRNPCCLPKSTNTGILCIGCSLWAKSIHQLDNRTQLYRRSTPKRTGPSGGHSHRRLPGTCDTHKFVPDVQHPFPSQGIRFALPRREVNLPRSDEQIARWKVFKRREGLHVQTVTRISRPTCLALASGF